MKNLFKQTSENNFAGFVSKDIPKGAMPTASQKESMEYYKKLASPRTSLGLLELDGEVLKNNASKKEIIKETGGYLYGTLCKLLMGESFLVINKNKEKRKIVFQALKTLEENGLKVNSFNLGDEVGVEGNQIIVYRKNGKIEKYIFESDSKDKKATKKTTTNSSSTKKQTKQKADAVTPIPKEDGSKRNANETSRKNEEQENTNKDKAVVTPITGKKEEEKIDNQFVNKKFDFNGIAGHESKSREKFTKRIFAMCKEADVRKPTNSEMNAFLESISDEDGNIDYGDKYFNFSDRIDSINNIRIENSFRDFYIKNAEKLSSKNTEKESSKKTQINWKKYPEFKNDNSEKFMQALLDNKEVLQKELNIPDDLYKDFCALAFAGVQQESNGGELINRNAILKTIATCTGPGLLIADINPRLMAKNTITAPILDSIRDTGSTGLTQIKVEDKGPETREFFKKFGITSKSNLWDPETSAIATMIVLAQNYKYDLPRHRANNPNLTDLEIMGYIHYNPVQLDDGTATPDTNTRIKDMEMFFEIGKNITEFPERTFSKKREVNWNNYEGKNNYYESGTPYSRTGCAAFIIYENAEVFKDGSIKYPANDNAWKMPHDIIIGKGIEIENLFKKTEIKKNLTTKNEINNFINKKINNKTIDLSKVKVGDVVNIYYPNSDSTIKAYKSSLAYQKDGKLPMPTTHVGQVTKKNGKLYITHNFPKKNKNGAIEGRILSDPIENLISGNNPKGLKIVAAYRMNTKELRDYLILETSYKKSNISPLQTTYSLNKTIPAKKEKQPEIPAPETKYGHYKYEFIPSNDLVSIPNFPGKEIHKDALPDLKNMIKDAKKDGFNLKINYSFRSKTKQKGMFDIEKNKGKTTKETAKEIAPPGYSEHQTGYAIDIKLFGTNNNNKSLYKWLQKNANKYNFEISFPENNHQGINYEPWHWRWIGNEKAKKALHKDYINSLL